MNDNVIMYMKDKIDRIKNDPICSYLNRLFDDQVPIGIDQKRQVIWGKDNAIQEPTAEKVSFLPEAGNSKGICSPYAEECEAAEES